MRQLATNQTTVAAANLTANSEFPASRRRPVPLLHKGGLFGIWPNFRLELQEEMVVSLLTIHPQRIEVDPQPLLHDSSRKCIFSFQMETNQIKSVGKSNRHLATAQICQNGILDIDICSCLTMQISSGSFISLSHSHVNIVKLCLR